jgi:hypothetical protein
LRRQPPGVEEGRFRYIVSSQSWIADKEWPSSLLVGHRPESPSSSNIPVFKLIFNIKNYDELG